MKRINGEPVKLVESLDELRVGAIIWYVDCGNCGRRHRAIIMDPTEFAPGCDRSVRCEPAPSCGATHLCPCSIGKVYRVIDEQLDADSTGERTTRELERAR